jgi:hypothetical protein
LALLIQNNLSQHWFSSKNANFCKINSSNRKNSDYNIAPVYLFILLFRSGANSQQSGAGLQDAKFGCKNHNSGIFLKALELRI